MVGITHITRYLSSESSAEEKFVWQFAEHRQVLVGADQIEFDLKRKFAAVAVAADELSAFPQTALLGTAREARAALQMSIAQPLRDPDDVDGTASEIRRLPTYPFCS